jgi:hypothetical protein
VVSRTSEFHKSTSSGLYTRGYAGNLSGMRIGKVQVTVDSKRYIVYKAEAVEADGDGARRDTKTQPCMKLMTSEILRLTSRASLRKNAEF